MARSIGWLTMFVGLDWVYAAGRAMASLAADRLARSTASRSSRRGPHGDARHRSGSRAGRRSRADELGARVFAVARTVPLIDALRISVGFFTTEDELGPVRRGVELLAAHTPETIPPRPDAHDPRRVSADGWPHAGSVRVAAALVGGGPLAPVPERPPTRRPGRAVEPRRRRRAGRAYLAYDVALSRGAELPRRRPAPARAGRLCVAVLASAASSPTSSCPSRPAPATVRRRSAWSAALGFFAAVPIAWLVMVVALQLVRPLLG